MNTEEIFEKIEFEVMTLFKNDKTGHCINHLKRVKNIALKIQQCEGGDKTVIGIAAMLHDVHRLMSDEQERWVHPKESLEIVKTILGKIKLSKEIVENILHCIEFHEEYDFSNDGITAKDLETLVLQDADNLDAIGAIGILRTGIYCGAHKIPMWIPEIPYNNSTYEESFMDTSLIHHCYHKLLRLKNNMNTDYGKKLAEHRHSFLEKFLEEFFAEWNGEK